MSKCNGIDKRQDRAPNSIRIQQPKNMLMIYKATLKFYVGTNIYPLLVKALIKTFEQSMSLLHTIFNHAMIFNQAMSSSINAATFSFHHYSYLKSYTDDLNLMIQSILILLSALIHHMAQNPELSPQIMYQYDTGKNIPWGFNQYNTPRQYQDPIQQVKERQYAKQKKGEKDKRYLTKKGFFMDYHIKVAKSIPSSCAHNRQEPWSFETLKNSPTYKNRKVDSKLIKESYLDKIQIEQKNRKKPGIGTYSLEKSLKEKLATIDAMKNKKKSVGEKRFYHEDTQFVSNGTPGSGNYNPHDSLTKIRKNKTTYKDWLKKHETQREKSDKKCRALPDPGTYKPLNSTFTTFDIIEKESKKKTKVNFLGTDSRFEYTRPDLKKIKQKRPDPISYNTLYEWRGKNKSPKHHPLHEKVVNSFKTTSIYH